MDNHVSIAYRRDLWQAVGKAGSLFTAEIGVAEGLFSEEILSWGFYRHYLVDRWECKPSIKGDSSNPQAWHDANYVAAMQRMERYKDRAIFLRGDSVEMAKQVAYRSLAFLYIDGDHSYEGVQRDLNAWVPMVAKGGVVALHDYENPAYGVKQAVKEFCAHNEYRIHLLPEDKLEDAGAYFYVDRF